MPQLKALYTKKIIFKLINSVIFVLYVLKINKTLRSINLPIDLRDRECIKKILDQRKQSDKIKISKYLYN